MPGLSLSLTTALLGSQTRALAGQRSKEPRPHAKAKQRKASTQSDCARLPAVTPTDALRMGHLDEAGQRALCSSAQAPVESGKAAQRTRNAWPGRAASRVVASARLARAACRPLSPGVNHLTDSAKSGGKHANKFRDAVRPSWSCSGRMRNIRNTLALVTETTITTTSTHSTRQHSALIRPSRLESIASTAYFCTLGSPSTYWLLHKVREPRPPFQSSPN